MPESTLALTLNDIAGDVGHHLGYGYGVNNGDTAWTTGQQREVDRCVAAGLRQFYYPPPLPGSNSSYDWSFLKPITPILLASGSTSAMLPDDFGGIEGDLTLSTGNSSSLLPVRVVGEGLIRTRYAELPSRTGRPEIAAVVPVRGTTNNAGQRFELTYWPAPDQDYTAEVAYYLLPNALTTILPFAYGGMLHCETIRESCLAIAEERNDDTGAGVHKAKFFERLAASISADRKFKGELVGYNGDRSDLRYGRRSGDPREWRYASGVTFDGVQY